MTTALSIATWERSYSKPKLSLMYSQNMMHEGQHLSDS